MLRKKYYYKIMIDIIPDKKCMMKVFQSKFIIEPFNVNIKISTNKVFTYSDYCIDLKNLDYQTMSGIYKISGNYDSCPERSTISVRYKNKIETLYNAVLSFIDLDNGYIKFKGDYLTTTYLC